MSSLTTWKQLSDGTDDVVLAVDFDATGRIEARFTDFVQLLRPGGTVWETRPQAISARPDLPAETYVKQWVDEVADSGRTVRGVLAFCAGSVYAAAIAAEIEKAQGTFPVTVLFDPERATAANLYWQFHKAVGQMVTTLGESEVGQAQDAGQRAQEQCTSLTELAHQLLPLYESVADSACAKLGLDERRCAEMSETAGAFLSYLSIAEQIDPTQVWRRCTAITSHTPTSGLNGFRMLNPGRDARIVAHEYRFETPHTELLRSSDVARAVSRLLTAR
ncbi:hypothetical protein [Streptomyces sp. NPDC087300]|uniref:hypothetical protein n=1 Tax=Streptomyces sp. NPDC087300 TaxID=3365780 RepID=UPI00380515F0